MAGIPTEHLDSEIKDLVSEVRSFRMEFSEFRGKTETYMGLGRWIGALLATTFLAVVASGITVVWKASQMDSAITHQSERLDRIEKIQERTATALEAMAKSMAGRQVPAVYSGENDRHPGLASKSMAGVELSTRGN